MPAFFESLSKLRPQHLPSIAITSPSVMLAKSATQREKQTLIYIYLTIFMLIGHARVHNRDRYPNLKEKACIFIYKLNWFGR